MMVPYQNSVVFYCKTTMWSCLPGTAWSHVRSRTSSCFGACYHSSFPENLATLSHRFVLQTVIFPSRLDESGISWHQPDLNLRQIWWLEHSQQLHSIPSLHPPLCHFSMVCLLGICHPGSSWWEVNRLEKNWHGNLDKQEWLLST